MKGLNVNKYMMDVITNQLNLRLNNPSYIIKAEDKLITLFGRGADDLREFVTTINEHLINVGRGDNKLRYNKNLTYKKVLTSFIENYEQIKIHESKESSYA